MKKPLQDYLAEATARIELRLDELVPQTNVAHGKLFEWARYSLLDGGKRLRPILTLATAELLGADFETALTPACAIEMLHTSSLVHQDLPAIDNADMRRGKASLHRVIPEGQAVLVGNYLLTFALETMVSCHELQDHQRINLTHVLAGRAGAYGMIGGQMMDLAFDGEALDLDSLETLHAMRTSALLTASLEAGGILGDADEGTMLILQTIGEAMGLAFQITEDLLDEEHEGPSYVNLLGIDHAREVAQNLYLTANDALIALPGDTQILSGLLDLVIRRID